MRNAGLEEAQAGIKIAGRNINNLRYADDHPYGRKQRRTKKPLLKVKEESEKVGLKLNIISCMKRVASPGSMHGTGCLGLVHWDDPEEG